MFREKWVVNVISTLTSRGKEELFAKEFSLNSTLDGLIDPPVPTKSAIPYNVLDKLDCFKDMYFWTCPNSHSSHKVIVLPQMTRRLLDATSYQNGLLNYALELRPISLLNVITKVMQSTTNMNNLKYLETNKPARQGRYTTDRSHNCRSWRRSLEAQTFCLV